MCPSRRVGPCYNDMKGGCLAPRARVSDWQLARYHHPSKGPPRPRHRPPSLEQGGALNHEAPLSVKKKVVLHSLIIAARVLGGCCMRLGAMKAVPDVVAVDADPDALVPPAGLTRGLSERLMEVG